jgi:hypothetical protein
MESRIPLPTDNIYKFYALFGLLLFIFSCSALIYNNQSNNSRVFEYVMELEAIKTLPADTGSVRKDVAEKKFELLKSDKKFYINAIGILVGIALWMMFFGFYKWHREIQPVQDEIAKLQLEKLRVEVAQLKNIRSTTKKLTRS